MGKARSMNLHASGFLKNTRRFRFGLFSIGKETRPLPNGCPETSLSPLTLLQTIFCGSLILQRSFF